jgi:hypothetical protein
MTSGWGSSVGAVESRTVAVNVPLGLTLPAASVAVHVTVVMPSGNVLPEGCVQSSRGEGSRLSFAAKRTMAPAGDVASATRSAGVEGAVRSIVQLKLVGGLSSPDESTPLTWKECEPSERAEYDTGLVQGAQPAAPESRRQMKLTVSGDPVNWNAALVS